MRASAPVAGAAATSGHPTIGAGVQASRRGRPGPRRVRGMWLWHRPVGGDGDLDGRTAIKAIVAVQRGDGVGHAFEWELVRDHLLQRQALALDDAHGGKGVLLRHAERTNEGGVLGDELRGGVKRYLTIIPSQPHLQEAPITVAQVMDAFGPGRCLAHTAIDDVGPEPAWGLVQHCPYALLRR